MISIEMGTVYDNKNGIEIQKSLLLLQYFIVLFQMYNEDDYLFCKSMQALMKNIAYLCSRTNSKVWGVDGWKKVVICIVSDGRAKVNSRVLDVLGIMGVYQHGRLKKFLTKRNHEGSCQ